MQSAALTPAVQARRGVPHALQALRAIVLREVLKFSQQTGRLVSALVRPLLWLAVFAAGFRNVFGVAIVEPYDTYIPYDVYIAPGLIGMVLLFNGMQSSLAMVYDREMGLMRLLLTAPLPRSWLLFCKLCATALLSVHIKQLENFAGTMNFVIFPMYFMSTALYPLWKLQESGAEWVYQLARFNPFTHAVEWIRFALYGKDPGLAPWVVLGCLAVFFGLACWGYDPQRGFGGLTKRGGGS